MSGGLWIMDPGQRLDFYSIVNACKYTLEWHYKSRGARG